MSGWNLPPGVSESDIPGNRPEDIAREQKFEELLSEGLTEAEAEAKLEDWDPCEEYEHDEPDYDEPDYDAMCGGADDDDRR